PDFSGDEIVGIEFPGDPDSDGGGAVFNGTIGRSLSRGEGKAVSANAGKKAKSNPEVKASFEGLNFYQQRFSRRGNQFSVEPPDQALCAGNGYELEAVNDVLNIYNSSGQSALPDNTATNIVSGFPRDVNHAVDLNSFYGYPPAVDRAHSIHRVPKVTIPSSLYNLNTQPFSLSVLTLKPFPPVGFRPSTPF